MYPDVKMAVKKATSTKITKKVCITYIPLILHIAFFPIYTFIIAETFEMKRKDLDELELKKVNVKILGLHVQMTMCIEYINRL